MASELPVPEWVQRLNGSTKQVAKAKSSEIPDPPGYVPTSKKASGSKQTTRKGPSAEEMDTLKVKKAWEVAIAPAKQLPMNAIGMYMTGNSLQIFSIMMVFMLFKTPITAVFGIQNTFARFETENNRDRILLAKLAFIACNCLALALGIWKVNGMGLLPTTRSDWLAWETARVSPERGVPGF